jgi:hypothetical protein
VRRWDATFWQTPELAVFATGGLPKKLFYFTRPAILYGWLKQGLKLRNVVVFTRSGPVTEDYSSFVRDTSNRVALPVDFIGSLTPGDLLSFLTLQRGNMALRRSKARRVSVTYRGLSDAWLDLRDDFAFNRPVSLSMDQILVPMTRDDEEEFHVLEKLMPSLESVVGPRCAEVLRSGTMLFLEGLSNPRIYGEDFSMTLLRHLMKE